MKLKFLFTWFDNKKHIQKENKKHKIVITFLGPRYLNIIIDLFYNKVDEWPYPLFSFVVFMCEFVFQYQSWQWLPRSSKLSPIQTLRIQTISSKSKPQKPLQTHLFCISIPISGSEPTSLSNAPVPLPTLPLRLTSQIQIQKPPPVQKVSQLKREENLK